MQLNRLRIVYRDGREEEIELGSHSTLVNQSTGAIERFSGSLTVATGGTEYVHPDPGSILRIENLSSGSRSPDEVTGDTKPYPDLVVGWLMDYRSTAPGGALSVGVGSGGRIETGAVPSLNFNHFPPDSHGSVAIGADSPVSRLSIVAVMRDGFPALEVKRFDGPQAEVTQQEREWRLTLKGSA